MKTVPNSLTIAMWVAGSSWALAILAYLLGSPIEWILPLVMLGVLTGIAEWVLRKAPD
jgi:hypothetical protein